MLRLKSGGQAEAFRTAISALRITKPVLAEKQHQQDDDRDRNADQPQQRAFA
jgi:hypothetical protein